MSSSCKVGIRVGLIGAGRMADAHLLAIREIEGIVLAGICSKTKLSARRLAEKYQIESTCDSISELYGLKIDILIVCVSPSEIFNVCVNVFAYKWVILMEKPIGLDYTEARKILEFSRKSESKIYVAMNRRHYCSTRQVLKDLAQDSSRRIVNIIDYELPDKALESGFSKNEVDRWMYLNSIHLIDYILIFCRGEISSVKQTIPWAGIAKGIVLASIEFTSEDIAIYQSIWNAPGPWSVSVSTNNNRWEMRPLEALQIQKKGENINKEVQIDLIDIKYKAGLRVQFEETIKALRGERTTLPDILEAFKSVELVRDIYNV